MYVDFRQSHVGHNLRSPSGYVELFPSGIWGRKSNTLDIIIKIYGAHTAHLMHNQTLLYNYHHAQRHVT